MNFDNLLQKAEEQLKTFKYHPELKFEKSVVNVYPADFSMDNSGDNVRVSLQVSMNFRGFIYSRIHKMDKVININDYQLYFYDQLSQMYRSIFDEVLSHHIFTHLDEIKTAIEEYKNDRTI